MQKSHAGHQERAVWSTYATIAIQRIVRAPEAKVTFRVRHFRGLAVRDEDARQVVDDLVQLLRSPEIGLNELVEQHLDAVANGRVVENVAEDTPKKPGRADSRKLLPSDVRHRHLTVTEQLSGLIDLIEVAVAGTIDVEERTVEMAREFLPENADLKILFSSDPANLAEEASPRRSQPFENEPKSVTAPSAGRMDAAKGILDTLRQLREVTGVSRADWLEPQEERLNSTRPNWRNA